MSFILYLILKNFHVKANTIVIDNAYSTLDHAKQSKRKTHGERDDKIRMALECTSNLMLYND